jgi:microcystin-dependent protein
MDSINFLGKPDYPLSCQDMEIIQDMINLSGLLSLLGGDKYILSGCVENNGTVAGGIVVISGTPYKFIGGSKKEKVSVFETKTDRIEFGKTYPEAWMKRTVAFSDSGAYSWSDFEQIPTNKELKTRIDSIRGDAPGTVKMWAGYISKIPAEYRLCNGDILDKDAFPELFDVLGTSFGGNGTSNFKLPDLRGRFVVGYDNSNPDYDETGKNGWLKEVTLTVSQIPEHDHTSGSTSVFNKLSARAADVDASNTPGAIDDKSADAEYRVGGMTSSQWTAATIQKVGDIRPHENRPPFLAIAFIIKVL